MINKSYLPLFAVTLVMLGSPCLTWAAKIKVVEAKDTIYGLTQTLDEVKKQVTIPVLFPSTLPEGTQPHYYITSQFVHDKKQQQYTFYINETADCNNAHYCNLGMVSAKTNQKPEIYKDKNKTVITQPISLIDNITGYYTPGHAMGSYFPPNIQWVKNKVLYTVQWSGGMNEAIEKGVLTSLATSMLLGEAE